MSGPRVPGEHAAHQQPVFAGGQIEQGDVVGLGGLLCFPMRVGAATALIEKPSPDILLDTIARYRCTALYTAPTAYRAILA